MVDASQLIFALTCPSYLHSSSKELYPLNETQEVTIEISDGMG